jgi:DNA-binding MarR family transcriptional regulator
VGSAVNYLHRIQFGHLAKVLLLLLDYENKERSPTVSQLVEETGISPSVFYGTLRTKLEKSGLVEFKLNPDRTITVHLTEKGRRLAECLKPCRELLGV